MDIPKSSAPGSWWRGCSTSNTTCRTWRGDGRGFVKRAGKTIQGGSWDENLDDIGLVVWTKSKKTRFAKEIVNWDQAWKTKEWAIPLTNLGSNFEALELGSGNLTVCELENHHISIGKSTRNGHAFTSKALNCQRVYYNTSVKSHPKSKTHSLKTIGRIKAESKEISIVAIGP
jgi:hypothetical protein